MHRAEVDLIVDKELAADDEKQNDARQDIGHAFIQAESGGNFARAAAQEDQQEGSQRHHQGVKLGEPRHHDRSKPLPADGVGGDGVVGAGHQQQPRQSTERTGERHRADDDLFDVDTDIARSVLALATTAIS